MVRLYDRMKRVVAGGRETVEPPQTDPGQGAPSPAGTVPVREIIAQPQLRIELVAGMRGLDNTVTWAHSSDLPDPSGWLSGGEMVMKNGRSLPRRAVDQVDFVASLVHAGARALVIGMDDQTPRFTDKMIDLAESSRFPLLRVPFSVPFAVIGRAVADRVARPEAGGIDRIARIYALIEAAVEHNDPRRFVSALGRELSCEVAIVDADTGNNALVGTARLPARTRRALLSAVRERGGHLPALLRVPESVGAELVVLVVPDEEATLLVLRQPAGQAVDMPLLQHAATAAAVAVAYASLDREHERERGTELLGQLLDAKLSSDAAERELSTHGVDLAHARLIAAPPPSDTSQRRLYNRLRRGGIRHLSVRRRGVLYLLADMKGPRRIVDQVKSDLRNLGGLGVSDLVRSGQRIPDAAREALWALAAARRHGGVVYYGSASAIPAIRDVNQAQALVDHALGPLVRHDQATGSELLHTLATYLTQRRSWVDTAKVLHVHRQTVIYRIKQVEQITGRDIGLSKDIAELWLALAALDAINGGAPVAVERGQ